MSAIHMKIVFGLSALLSCTFATPLALPGLDTRQSTGSCRNQSCEIAYVAGSTGKTVYPYSTLPSGDTQDGDCCIVRYFPAVKDSLYKYRPGLQSYCASHGGDAPLDSNPPGVNSVSTPYITSSPSNKARDDSFGSAESTVVKRQSTTCKPKMLLFIKGTLEPGDLGIVVGPLLNASLPSDWGVVGVDYDNSFANDYCLGLPGGLTTRQALENLASDCPDSVLAISGYSSGALASRNALARADPTTVSRIRSLVTFGDPFIGAPIGQYNGPVHVFCKSGDKVCDGTLNITLQHLTYGDSAAAGANLLEQDTA